MAQLEPGLHLADRYLLERRIGAGGMSQVWRAVDTVLGRDVAVKSLAPAYVADPALRTATHREARAAARLAHPNVTQVFDYGEAALPDGSVVPYLVMELLDGQTLADRLRAGPLPWPQAVGVGGAVAAALAAAHQLGIVHRDIKPANVVLTPAGPKVVDFGIAALTGAGPGADELVAGTPSYVAPELLRGEPATPASDVYGLGALLHEMVTGDPPWPVVSWAEARLALQTRAAGPPDLDLPEVPAPVRRLCRDCLSTAPGDRPTSEHAARVLADAAGHRAVPVGRARVRNAPAVPTPTLLDAARPEPAPSPWPEGAAVARRRTGRAGLAAMAVFALLATVLAVAAAAMLASRTPGRSTSGPPGAGVITASPTTPAPSTTAPETAAALIGAIEARLAEAIASGQIGRETALDLAHDVSELRDRLEHGRLRDVIKRADSLRDRVEQRAEDDRIDAAVAADLDALLVRLIRLGD